MQTGPLVGQFPIRPRHPRHPTGCVLLLPLPSPHPSRSAHRSAAFQIGCRAVPATSFNGSRKIKGSVSPTWVVSVDRLSFKEMSTGCSPNFWISASLLIYIKYSVTWTGKNWHFFLEWTSQYCWRNVCFLHGCASFRCGVAWRRGLLLMSSKPNSPESSFWIMDHQLAYSTATRLKHNKRSAVRMKNCQLPFTTTGQK